MLDFAATGGNSRFPRSDGVSEGEFQQVLDKGTVETRVAIIISLCVAHSLCVIELPQIKGWHMRWISLLMTY